MKKLTEREYEQITSLCNNSRKMLQFISLLQAKFSDENVTLTCEGKADTLLDIIKVEEMLKEMEM